MRIVACTTCRRNSGTDCRQESQKPQQIEERYRFPAAITCKLGALDCGPCQRTPQRSKEGRTSSTSFRDGSDFLRTIAPNQHVVRSNASLVESCATGVPFSM